MSLQDELEKRKAAVGYMISLGLRAGLCVFGRDRHGQTMRAVIFTAATFLHRFYMRRSIKDTRPEKVAAAILFLASKTEEAPLKLRHVAGAASFKFDLQNAPGQITNAIKDESQLKWEKIILFTEEQVLEVLCFDLVVEQPWSGVVKGLRALMGVGAGAVGVGVAGRSMSAVVAEGNAASDGGEQGQVQPTVEAGAGAAEGDVVMTDNVPATETSASSPSTATEAIPDETFERRDWAFQEDEILETSMVLLNEIYVTPLPILFVPPILSVAILVLSISIMTQHSTSQTRRYLYTSPGQSRYRNALSQTLKMELERGKSSLRFAKEDADVVDACLNQFNAYLSQGLVDHKLRGLLLESTTTITTSNP